MIADNYFSHDFPRLKFAKCVGEEKREGKGKIGKGKMEGDDRKEEGGKERTLSVSISWEVTRSFANIGTLLYLTLNVFYFAYMTGIDTCTFLSNGLYASLIGCNL